MGYVHLTDSLPFSVNCLNKLLMDTVIGVDFGTDSVRSVVVNAQNGEELAGATHYYTRWQQGLYCDPSKNQFRQHPLDYIEGLEKSIKKAVKQCKKKVRASIKGIAVDTTGSTPCAVDKKGRPLALKKEFADNPNAMFVLWKDHTATKEAAEINALCSRSKTDYSKYEGGIYSSEWFWAKILHIHRVDDKVAEAAHSWVEHCDWIPYLLCGGKDVSLMKRSRCAAGHKALWHPDWGGLPPRRWLKYLDPLLYEIRERMYTDTFTSDVPAGTISQEWAKRLGLPNDVTVAVGAFDAHMGAVGGQIKPYFLSKVMGTSTCDMLVAPTNEVADKLIRGICGQVDGSVIPGMVGMEAGQSAFGDVYAWYRDLLMWSVKKTIGKSKLIDKNTRKKMVQEAEERLIPRLSKEAMTIPPSSSGIVALDWLNGRRTPDANQELKAGITGINLGTTAPMIFRALVEATCFGARQIVDRFQEEGISIEGIIGLGGVAKKSPFVMQTMADVLNRPISIATSEQTCALGAAMFAATAAGIHPNVETAMAQMGAGFDQEYLPNSEHAAIYDRLYTDYQKLGDFVSDQIAGKN